MSVQRDSKPCRHCKKPLHQVVWKSAILGTPRKQWLHEGGYATCIEAASAQVPFRKMDDRPADDEFDV